MEQIKEKHPELDVTKFVNIDDEPYDIYIDGRVARHLEAGEEQQVPIFVAQVGAKHLVDRVLGKQDVRDTMRDTPERKSLFARILPDWAEEIKVKPLSEEEYRKKIDARLEEQDLETKKQREEIEKLAKADDAKDKEIEKLKKELEKAVEKAKKKAE